MFLFLAFHAATAPQEPMLAFTARIYYPPSDKRKSHYQLYLSDLHGKHRKQLTFGTNDPMGVTWIGKDALCWADQNAKLYVSRLKPFRPIQLTVAEVEVENNKSLDGMPRGLALIGGNQQITATGLKPYSPPAPLPWPDKKEAGDGKFQYTMPNGTVFLVDLAAGTITANGKAYNFEDKASDGLYPIAMDGSLLWVKARTYGGMHGRVDQIYKFDPVSGAFNKVIGDIAYIDFIPSSPYYAGMDLAGEDLIPYGPKKNVVGAHLFAGDWKKGKRWLVLGGTVHVSSVSVQPER